MKNTFVIALLFTALCSFAQQNEIENSKPKKIIHHIGLSAGTTYGFGLSYKLQHHRFAHQFTFLPYAEANFSCMNYAYTLHFRLKENRFVDCNVYAGINSIFGNIDDALLGEYKNKTLATSIGTGLNFNFHLTQNFSLNAGGGFAKYQIIDDLFDINGISPTIDLGLFYKL